MIMHALETGENRTGDCRNSALEERREASTELRIDGFLSNPPHDKVGRDGSWGIKFSSDESCTQRDI